jgi:UDP-N-acetyl-D-mannosaminuronic acid dehydrogenase
MNAESSLRERIRARKADIVVLGLGHVGLPTALVFARAGFNVKGVDNDLRKLEILKGGASSMREPGVQETLKECLHNGRLEVGSDGSDWIRNSSFVIVCVPTPVENAAPDLRSFEAAFGVIAACAHAELMIMIESTLPPSTTSKVVAPELCRLGYKIDEEVFLAYCPERLAPMQALSEFVSNTRIVGGVGPKSGVIAAELYGTVCKDVLVTDSLTAELAKVSENTFRDLNIAYANLLAFITEDLGGDVDQVIRLANTHPRVSIHRPGLGVGGPCLPKDPYMLIHNIPADLGMLIKVARRLNDRVPSAVVDLLARSLTAKGVAIGDAKVAVLGVAYKADMENATNSPAKPVVQELLARGARVSTFDPYSLETFGAHRSSSIEQALHDVDCIVIVTPHSDFKSITPNLIRRLARPKCIVFDGPRMLDPVKLEEHGLIYLGTGYRRKERPF